MGTVLAIPVLQEIMWTMDQWWQSLLWMGVLLDLSSSWWDFRLFSLMEGLCVFHGSMSRFWARGGTRCAWMWGSHRGGCGRWQLDSCEPDEPSPSLPCQQNHCFVWRWLRQWASIPNVRDKHCCYVLSMVIPFLPLLLGFTNGSEFNSGWWGVVGFCGRERNWERECVQESSFCSWKLLFLDLTPGMTSVSLDVWGALLWTVWYRKNLGPCWCHWPNSTEL